MKKDEDTAAVARIVPHPECMTLSTSEYHAPVPVRRGASHGQLGLRVWVGVGAWRRLAEVQPRSFCLPLLSRQESKFVNVYRSFSLPLGEERAWEKLRRKLADSNCPHNFRFPSKRRFRGQKPKAGSESKVVWTRVDFIKLLFLVLATFDYKLWVSYALGYFVRSEGKAAQPIARGLLPIYATHTVTVWCKPAS